MMESSSLPSTPGKNGKPCPSCSPVKYGGGMTYVCSDPVVVVQRVSPKADHSSHSSRSRKGKKDVPDGTNKASDSSGEVQNKHKKSTKRACHKLALKKSGKGKTTQSKSSSLSQLQVTRLSSLPDAVDLNESDDFKSSVNTGPNKRRKLSEAEKANLETTDSHEVHLAKSKKPRREKALSDIAGSGEERLKMGSLEGTSSAIRVKEIECNSIEGGTTELNTKQVSGTESKCDVEDMLDCKKVTDESDPPLDMCGESSEETKSCVICRQSIKSEDLQSHQKACLSHHFTRGANPVDGSAGVSDEVLARTVQQTELMESSPSLEIVLCQICNLDLTDLSSYRQTQHVNSCMDKKEAADAVAMADTGAKQRARKAVLDCPMCGKPLKTEASRKSHLNRCSKSCNVGANQLSQLIEQQRREHEAGLTVGEIPFTTRAQKTKKRGQTTKTKKASKALDEDTQFALALSTSLVEEQQKQETQLLDQLESIDRLAMGCRKLDKDIKKGRKKKGNAHVGEQIPPLLKYSTEEIRKKIAERVAMVISHGEGDQVYNTPPTSESHVTQWCSKNMERPHSTLNSTGKERSLWQISCMNAHTVDTGTYYVKELSPLVKVSTAHFDRLMAKKSAPTGKEKVDEKRYNLSKVVDTEIGDESGVDFVSTQTAVVLAELAAEEERSVLQSSPDPFYHNVTDINSSQNSANRHRINQTSTSPVKSVQHVISQSVPEKDVDSLDIEGATYLPGPHNTACVQRVDKLSNYTAGSEKDSCEEFEEEAASRADNRGDIKAATPEENHIAGTEGLTGQGRVFFDSKKVASSFDASGFCLENENKVNPAIITQGLQSQLSLMVNNPLFSDIKLLSQDQEVIHAHRVILAARCPQVIEDLQHTDEDLHLEEFTSRAVLSVIKFIYAGEIVTSGNGEEEIRLARRLGVEELSEILLYSVGDKWDSNTEAHGDQTLEKEQVLDDLLNSLFDESSDTVVQETSSENLEEEKDEEEMDSLYKFMSTQREKSSAVKGDNTRTGFNCHHTTAPLSVDQCSDAGLKNMQQKYVHCTGRKQTDAHNSGQETMDNREVKLSPVSSVKRPATLGMSETLEKSSRSITQMDVEKCGRDNCIDSHYDNSKQTTYHSSSRQSTEKDILKNRGTEKSVASNSDNEIEENRLSEKNSENNIGRGLKRIITDHCHHNEDRELETVSKRIKLEEASSDNKSDPDFTDLVELEHNSKSLSAVDLCDGDKNHFDIVHSMLNELSPGEAESYQPDWFKSSCSVSSDHEECGKERSCDKSKRERGFGKHGEDMEHSQYVDLRENICGDGKTGYNSNKKLRKGGKEHIVIDIDSVKQISNEDNKCENKLGSRPASQACSSPADSYAPLQMSVDCDVTPDMVSFENTMESICANSLPRLTSTGSHKLKTVCSEDQGSQMTCVEIQRSNDSDGHGSELNSTAERGSKIRTSLIQDVNSSNGSLPDVAETSKDSSDIESRHSSAANGDERLDATAEVDAAENVSSNHSDSWLIPDTPVKIPSLSGGSVLNEDRSKTFGSKSRRSLKKFSSVREVDPDDSSNKQKFKLKHRRRNNNMENLTFLSKNASELENSGICDISRYQPSFSTAIVSTPVLQKTVKNFNRQRSLSNSEWKKGLNLSVKDSADDIVSFSENMFSGRIKIDNVEIPRVSGSSCNNGDTDVGETGQSPKDTSNCEKLSENCTLSEDGSVKMSSDLELTPEQRKELLKDVDIFFVRTPSEVKKNPVICKLKKLSPRTRDVSESTEIKTHADPDSDDELPEISEDQYSIHNKCSSSENVDQIELNPMPIELDVDDNERSKTIGMDRQLTLGNVSCKYQQATEKKYTFKKIKSINNNEPISCIPEKACDIVSSDPPKLHIELSQNGTSSGVQPPLYSRAFFPPPLIVCSAVQPDSPTDKSERSPDEGQGEESSLIKASPNSDHAMSQGDTDRREPDSPLECPDVDVWEDFDDAGVEFNPMACDSFVNPVSINHRVQDFSPTRNEDSDHNNAQKSGTAQSPVKKHHPEPIDVTSSPLDSNSSGEVAQPLAHTLDQSLVQTPDRLLVQTPNQPVAQSPENLLAQSSNQPSPESLSATPPELDSPPLQVGCLDQFEERQERQPEWEPGSPSGGQSPLQICEARASQPAEVNFTKTPTWPPQASKKPKKKWVPPSPFTPMADYDRMNTPQLKKEMQKFGIKPVSKKRMIVCLKDIYNQTHQYETDSEVEVSFVEVEGEATVIDAQEKNTKRDGKGGKTQSEKRKVASNGYKTKPSAKETTKSSHNSATKPSKKGALGKSAELTAATKEFIDLSQEEDDSEQEEESYGSDMVEESFFMENEMLSSQQESSPNLHEELYKFFTSNTDLYSKVLSYEPLEFDWLREEIKKAGIKCSMPKLIHFMDERCITFTMKSRRADKPRGRRRKAKKKTTESAVS